MPSINYKIRKRKKKETQFLQGDARLIIITVQKLLVPKMYFFSIPFSYIFFFFLIYLYFA